MCAANSCFERSDNGDGPGAPGMAPARLVHEFRTPLGGIMGGVEILRMEEHGLGESALLALDLIEQSALRLERTALNYLLFLALRSGRMVSWTDPEEENVGEVVSCAALRVAREEGRRGDLVLSLVEARERCGNCLDRIVQEVVSNAFRFSEPGSKVEVALSRCDRGLLLRCRDNGCGMSGEEIAAIGPFRQFRRSEREQQGLGLGLEICRAVSACRGWSLAFKPEGDGLTVELLIP